MDMYFELSKKAYNHYMSFSFESPEPFTVPDEYFIGAERRICNITPGQMFFAQPSSVVIDRATRRLLVDTVDPVASKPLDKQEYESIVPITRIMRMVGKKAYDGYLVDMRFNRQPCIVGRSTNDEPLESQENWTFHGTTYPLGALFAENDHVAFVGELDLQADALAFAKESDAAYADLAQLKTYEEFLRQNGKIVDITV